MHGASAAVLNVPAALAGLAAGTFSGAGPARLRRYCVHFRRQWWKLRPREGPSVLAADPVEELPRALLVQVLIPEIALRRVHGLKFLIGLAHPPTRGQTCTSSAGPLLGPLIGC